MKLSVFSPKIDSEIMVWGGCSVAHIWMLMSRSGQQKQALEQVRTR
jgi:hypothetical protein